MPTIRKAKGGRQPMYFGMDRREANTVAVARHALQKTLGIDIEPMRTRLVMAALHGCTGVLRHVSDKERVAICEYLMFEFPKMGTYRRKKK
jgi:hypothetical protein